MKKTLLLLSLLVIFTMSASAEGIRLVRLTVINKSGMDIELSLTGKNQEEFYYLRVPEGDRSSPTEVVFTVVPDEYSSQIYYVELWDPVYGATCGLESQTLDVSGNVRLVVTECTMTPPNNGEPPAIIKYGAPQVKKGR